MLFMTLLYSVSLGSSPLQLLLQLVTMENTDRNRVDYTSHPEWLWPAYKFGLEPDDQFTTLHERFNTWKMPLHNANAFHADLSDLAHTHNTKDKLFQALE